jgi:hypothetical protein
MRLVASCLSIPFQCTVNYLCEPCAFLNMAGELVANTSTVSGLIIKDPCGQRCLAISWTLVKTVAPLTDIIGACPCHLLVR